MANLHFHSGPLQGKRAHLKAARISIGSAAENNIRIDDPSVAPRHLVLVREEGSYTIYIDASRPAVAVNGVQVINYNLRDGDTLQIGRIRAQFKNRQTLPRANASRPPGVSTDQAMAPEDGAPLPLEDMSRTGETRRLVLAVGILVLWAGAAAVFLREKPKAQPELVPLPPPLVNLDELQEAADRPLQSQTDPTVPGAVQEPAVPRVQGLPVGVGASGLRADGRVLRTKNFKSHQEAVDAARPGDSVIFDSLDPKPILADKPIRDVQFLSGSATWEIRSDLVDCQFIFHEAKKLTQAAGKLERCVFYRCPLKHSRFTHTDAVSFYFDERSSLNPRDNPDGGKAPILLLSGFVRDVLILKPFSGTAASEKHFDMNWGPAIRIHATDPVGDGSGTYLLSPVVLGQRAWTPHQISRGNGVTYAHLTADGSIWADPVLEILRGNDCVVLCTSFGGATTTHADQYKSLPTLLKYHDHTEYGHDNGPAFRGAAITINGLRTRIVAHGDARKPWTVGRKSGLPGLHYADGIVACDPFIRQFATEHGGLRVNLAEPRGLFVQQVTAGKTEYLSNPSHTDGGPLYPPEGPDLFKPVFVPLKDLRLSPGEFDHLPLVDMSGQAPAQIEKALATDKSIFLGPGVYEFQHPVKSGFVAGAGMDKTVLKWPDDVDGAQRGCRGMINCTIAGGHTGFNEQSPTDGRAGKSLFLRTRFRDQKTAAVNLHSSHFQTWQDCEFINTKLAFTHGQEKRAPTTKTDKAETAAMALDSLNICNCSFRDIHSRAIDLTIESPVLGHVGIHNCRFDDVGEAAIRLIGGQTHLIQGCDLHRCAYQSYSPAIAVASSGALALSHLDIDCSMVRGNPACISLKGMAAISHCNIRGMTAAVHCDGVLVVDALTADGRLEASPNSLVCRSQFKNCGLPQGIALTRDKDFSEVTSRILPSPFNRLPPILVENQRVRTFDGWREIEWKPIESPESGLAYYMVTADGTEVARVPLEYSPPGDDHSPLLTVPFKTRYIDLHPQRHLYDVLAVNGAGLTWDGKEAPLRRLGPARGRFLQSGNEVLIKGFPVLAKGKGMEIIDGEGKRQAAASLGNKGLPNTVYFELGAAVEPP